jgi:hypothetical protein
VIAVRNENLGENLMALMEGKAGKRDRHVP